MIAIAAMICFGVCALSGIAIGQDESANSDSEKPPAEIKEPANNPYNLNTKPKVAQDIGVDSQTGEYLVMDIPFHDEENRFVKIGDYFEGEKPVLLSFNYSDCPKLCSVQLENMTDTLRQIKFKADQDFEIVSISIDPNEQTSRARQSKEKYVKRYSKFDRKNSDDGWHFLTGKEKDIQLIADICGFRYKYVPEQKLFSHPPVFILVSPKGKIVRYIHGLDYDPNTMEKALIEAAEGKIGSPINILAYGLGCFTFNESTGKYTFQAMAIMRIGGALTALLLAVTLIPYWFLRRGNKPDKPKKGMPVPNAPAGSA
jgi:protein SCO1/2